MAHFFERIVINGKECVFSMGTYENIKEKFLK